MSKYAKAALLAAEIARGGTNAAHAWEEATIKMFGKGTVSQKKGCPKGAFLGLCEEGLVKGVRGGTYLTNSKTNKNKKYALAALAVCCTSHTRPQKIGFQPIFYPTNCVSSPIIEDFLRHQAQKIHKCNRLLELLKKERSMPENRNAFWQRVPGTPNTHNGQLDVLFALVEKEHR